MTEENIIKGDSAEAHFKRWLDKQRIPYFYIQQSTDSFSLALKESLFGKRPDFLILVPYFGFMLVDVKYKKLNLKYNSYPVDKDETMKYSYIQRKFNLPVWFVMSNEESAYQNWLWISVAKVIELGVESQISTKSNEGFFPIEPKNFTQLADDDSLERLFSKLFKEI